MGYLSSNLLAELGAAASRFDYQYALQDSVLSQIVTTSSREIEGGSADRMLGIALCIRIAQPFVERLLLPTSKGLSPGRLPPSLRWEIGAAVRECVALPRSLVRALLRPR